MILRVLRFVRLPILLILIFAIGRFWFGYAGTPYTPRTNAIFSTVMLTIVSSLYWGALSKRVGGFGWVGTVLAGVTLGLWNQILIFLLTALSYMMGVEATSYYTNWDNLNIEEGTTLTMGEALGARAGGLIAGPIIGLVAASIGRLFAFMAPEPAHESAPVERDEE